MEQSVETLDSGTEEGTAEQSNETAETTKDTSFSPDDPQDDQPEPAGLLEAESDDEEIDYEGEKFRVPKKLRDAFLRQQDYTQKTQSVAEQRKAVEAHAQQIQQQAQAQQQHIAEYAEAFALDSQLKQYQDVNWQQLIDQDPVQAMKLDRQMRELQQRRDQVVSSVTQKQQQQTLQVQRENARRLQEGQAVLEREIKGWSPETGKELIKFGQELGFNAEELSQVNDPRAVKLLHKAWQFDQLMKKQAAPKEKPETQEKPVTRITASKGTATKDPSKMSDNEFAQWRKRQIAQRT